MKGGMRILRLLSLLGGIAACSELELNYFQHRTNEVTIEQVAKRYGAPHKAEQQDGEKTVWTYYDRGSGTAGYTGIARGGFCRAYVLTFDKQDILRTWKQEECTH